MNAYFDSKLTDLRKISDPEGHLKRLTYDDTDLQKKWRNERKNNDSYWAKINSNDDVIALIDYFDEQVSFMEGRLPYGSMIAEDKYIMALAEYRAVQGLRKMAQFIDKGKVSQVEFTALSKAEIDALFERMKRIILKMNQQTELRAMQDRR